MLVRIDLQGMAVNQDRKKEGNAVQASSCSLCTLESNHQHSLCVFFALFNYNQGPPTPHFLYLCLTMKFIIYPGTCKPTVFILDKKNEVVYHKAL